MTNEKLPMLFSKIEALDSKNHKDTVILRDVNYSYAKETHSVPAVIGEVPLLSGTYPVAFVKLKDDSYSLVTVLSFSENSNAYIDDDGNWLAQYVPSYIRQYPFAAVRVEGDEENKVMCLDPNAPHFDTSTGKEESGQNLFDDEGNPGEILKIGIKLVEEFDLSIRQTKEFCDELAKSDLIEKRQENSEYGNMQFYGIKVDEIKNVSEEKISEWQKKGYLNILLHLLHSQRAWREIEVRLRLKGFEPKKALDSKDTSDSDDTSEVSDGSQSSESSE